MTAVGAVDQQVAHARHAVARGRHALHDDLEDLLLLEDASDLDPLHQGGRGAAHVARLDAEALRSVEVGLDLDGRLSHRQLEARVCDTVDLGHDPVQLACLAPEGGQVLAVDADDERVVGAGEHVEVVARDPLVGLAQRTDVPDPLRRIADDFAIDAARAVDHIVDRCHRRVVVGARVDADPELARVDVDHLVARHRPSNVGPYVVHARDRSQLAAQVGGDPGHPRVGRPGFAVETDQQVLSLNEGISDVPSSGSNARPTTTAAAAAMSAALGLWTTRDSAPR